MLSFGKVALCVQDHRVEALLFFHFTTPPDRGAVDEHPPKHSDNGFHSRRRLVADEGRRPIILKVGSESQASGDAKVG